MREMQEVIIELWGWADDGDFEIAHQKADELLIEALEIASEKGVEDYEVEAIKTAYHEVGKFYS